MSVSESVPCTSDSRIDNGLHPREARLDFPLHFAMFYAVGLALAAPALAWPMVFDDLVLLRRFTGDQILASFHGQWDPERLMNWGYRPLSLLFNHTRYGLFGENVAAHRLFLIALYALYGALLVPVARRFGLPQLAAVLAVILSMCSVTSVFHYVWLTDGNHLIQGLAFVIALRLLLAGLEIHSRTYLALSLFCLVAGLVTREDTFAALPAVLLLGYVDSRRARRGEGLMRAYAILLGLLCVGLYAYRHAILPRAQGVGLDVFGVLWGAWRAFHPLGVKAFNEWSHALLWIWWGLLAIAVPAALFARRRIDLRPAALWLACTILAATPGLNLRRENLLFFPVSFASLTCVALLAEFSRLARVAKAVSAGVLLVGIAGGASVSHVFAENFHPRSLRVIWWNGRYVYGAYSRKAVIPRHRLEAVMRQLAGAGVRDEWLHINRTPKLVQRALVAGRRRPGTEGRFFYPLLAWDED